MPMPMPPTLHFAPDNASLVVRLVLEALGQPYRTVLIDRARREQDGEAYRRLNPAGLIPVCEIDGVAVFETGAIVLMLADRAGHLMPPPGHADRGRLLAWLFHVSNTVHANLRLVFYPHLLGGGTGTAPDRLARDRVRRGFGLLDGALGESGASFLGGAAPSVVDYYVATCLRWSQLYPLADPLVSDPAAWPTLTAMARTLQDRPEAHRARAAEGIPAPLFVAPRPPDGSRGAAL